jgi:hypothetical protein
MQYFIVNKSTLKIEKTYNWEAQVVTKDGVDSVVNYLEWIPSLSEPICAHLPLPENLNPDCIKAVLIDDVITLIEDTDKVAAKSQAAKDVLIAAAKSRMDEDIEAAQIQAFNTSLQTSAIRTAVTALDMSLNPSAYLCTLLPTVEAVSAFASQHLAPARTCAIYCLERIYQFEQEKASILS